MAEVIRLSPTGDEPQVDIVIGFAQFGKYRFSLGDSTGGDFKVIAEGDNADSRPDVFVIPESPEALDGRTLRWKVIVAAFESGPGEFYSVIVKVSQNGSVVPDAPFKNKGPLDEGVAIVQRDVTFRLA